MTRPDQGLVGDRTEAWTGLCWGRRGPAGRGAGGQGTPPQTKLSLSVGLITLRTGGRLLLPTATFPDMPGHDSPEHLREMIWPEVQLFLQNRGGSKKQGRGPPKAMEARDSCLVETEEASGAAPHLCPASIQAPRPLLINRSLGQQCYSVPSPQSTSRRSWPLRVVLRRAQIQYL